MIKMKIRLYECNFPNLLIRIITLTYAINCLHTCIWSIYTLRECRYNIYWSTFNVVAILLLKKCFIVEGFDISSFSSNTKSSTSARNVTQRGYDRGTERQYCLSPCEHMDQQGSKQTDRLHNCEYLKGIEAASCWNGICMAVSLLKPTYLDKVICIYIHTHTLLIVCIVLNVKSYHTITRQTIDIIPYTSNMNFGNVWGVKCF